MPRKDSFEVEAEVLECLSKTMFRVQLANGHVVLAYVTGKMHLPVIPTLPGDKVQLEMSPYDLTKARITFRQK